jgi:NitT/TauT family transport system ATP-binding protein
VAIAPLLAVEEVTLQYRSGARVVTATERVSFSVGRSERFVILGPSGCGKSTLLKAIAGFVTPVHGRIALNGSPVDRPGPDRVVVFQEFDQLLPWKTVRQNIAFALTASGRLPARDADQRARQYIDKVRLTDFADSYPHTLSGGMKQRVAIARAMAMEPAILLMDEPFAALDALTRARMQDELRQLWQDTQFTIVFVTHSIGEAIKVGTRILLLSAHPGRVKAEVVSTGEDVADADGRLLSARIHETLFSEPVAADA